MIRRRSSSGCRLPSRGRAGSRICWIRSVVGGFAIRPSTASLGCGLFRRRGSRSRRRRWLCVNVSDLAFGGFWWMQDVHAKVPELTIKNARNGRVRPLNAGYRADAAYTPNAPAARPAAPPIAPPFTVALPSLSVRVPLSQVACFILVMLLLLFFGEDLHAVSLASKVQQSSQSINRYVTPRIGYTKVSWSMQYM